MSPSMCSSVRGVANQIIAAVGVSIISINAGMVNGWISPLSLKLLSQDSPVEVITKGELATLASLPNYVSLIIAFAVSYIATRYGRKFTLITVGVPSIISGITLTFASSKYWLYIGRALSGFSVKGASIAAMYLSEAATPSIRGLLVSTCYMTMNIGTLGSYILGKILSYSLYNAIFIVLSTIFTISMFWIPETPHFLIEKSRADEAKKSLLWLRGGDERLVKEELELIISSKVARNEETVTFFQVMQTRVTRKALIISVGGFSLLAFSGIYVVTNYAGLIFQEAGSPLDPDDSSIIIACLILGSTSVNLCLVDKFGRRALLYLSFIGGSLSLLTLSAFLYLKHEGWDLDYLSWVPIICLGVYVVAYGLGLAAVPGILLNEVAPTNTKPVVSAVTVVFGMGSAVLAVQSFPYLDEYIGLYFAFLVPTFFNIVGLFFTWFIVPETKGKSLSEITKELEAR